MRILVDINRFYASIGNGEDRKKFKEVYGHNLSTDSALFVELPDHKTLTQLGAIWRDWTITGKLLKASANSIYLKLMKSEECRDIFFQKDEHGNWEFNTLSGVKKQRTSDLIER